MDWICSVEYIILLDEPSIYTKVTCLVDEGKAMDVVYLGFSKAFDTVFLSILLEKVAAHGLDMGTTHWVKKLSGFPGPGSCGEQN